MELDEWMYRYSANSINLDLITQLTPYMLPGQTLEFEDITDERQCMILLLASIKKYTLLHSELLGQYSGTIIPQPSKLALERIRRPFQQFLEEHALHLLVPLFTALQANNYYGELSHIPTLYGLWWNTPALLEDVIMSFQPGGRDVTSVLKHGFQNLFEQIAEHHNLRSKIRFDYNIAKIERESEHDDNVVEEFDFLIVAVPQRDIVEQGILDANELEFRAFADQTRGYLLTSVAQFDATQFPHEVYQEVDELNGNPEKRV
ncbi:hypothetical protein SARC_10777 [Sphaeroforma arctica JP610]|uniref:Amine oxidase domain-containing protein n=1 Tax=Sphaeroforma arctica JP610 TaxID=667725 RepID=A0A0L0FIY6_9EUKA|nr:hypothetical protein SARC_10777 [Sphaeroforma arctica JP610]KNC76739.1 hypothetical protein SARC_10777 [Sphaeroforma arctica JP610]|eukprot:XP_014150641.1 hypothetical protein SARC_10777 [Sphaeroforma arctica JP610]